MRIGSVAFEPYDIVIDKTGSVYVADRGYHRVLKVDVSKGTIIHVAGTTQSGPLGDGGPATKASLNVPVGLTLSATGDLYIADALNNRVRKVDTSTGLITTVAGNGTEGFSGDMMAQQLLLLFITQCASSLAQVATSTLLTKATVASARWTNLAQSPPLQVGTAAGYWLVKALALAPAGHYYRCNVEPLCDLACMFIQVPFAAEPHQKQRCQGQHCMRPCAAALSLHACCRQWRLVSRWQWRSCNHSKLLSQRHCL